MVVKYALAAIVTYADMEGKWMIPDELQAIRERVNKTMPGPWEWSKERSGVLLGGHDEFGWLKVFTVLAFDIDPDDADFIAYAREDVPNLLDEVQRLRNALDEICALYGDEPMSANIADRALAGESV